jgi:TolB-like protein
MQTAAFRQGPAILVAPFEDDGGQSAHFGLSGGFTREIIAGLTRFSDLFVFGPETAFRHGGAADLQGMAAELGVDFILAGGVTVSDRFRVTASLIDAKSGQYVWSGKFDGDLAAAEVIKIRDDLADEVVRELVRPYGIIFNEQASGIEGRPPQSFTSYECVLQFQQYWRRYDAGLYSQVRECLERATIAEPEYADAFASLALIYANAYRFDLDQGTVAFDPRTRALELARRAVDLAPASTRGYQALHLVHWLMNDVQRSLKAAERGFALNPNDTEIMADLGLRYCLRAQWDKGLPQVQDAFARNPAQPGQYRIATFLHHYINGRYGEALTEARKIEVPGVIYNHIALAMAYAQLGQTKQADAEIGRALAIDPAYGDHAIADLQKTNLHPDIIRAVVDGLKKAGLTVEGSPTRAAS